MNVIEGAWNNFGAGMNMPASDTLNEENNARKIKLVSLRIIGLVAGMATLILFAVQTGTFSFDLGPRKNYMDPSVGKGVLVDKTLELSSVYFLADAWLTLVIAAGCFLIAMQTRSTVIVGGGFCLVGGIVMFILALGAVIYYGGNVNKPGTYDNIADDPRKCCVTAMWNITTSYCAQGACVGAYATLTRDALGFSNLYLFTVIKQWFLVAVGLVGLVAAIFLIDPNDIFTKILSMGIRSDAHSYPTSDDEEVELMHAEDSEGVRRNKRGYIVE